MVAIPRIREQFRYSGYIMHNCSFLGFNNTLLERIRAERGTNTKDCMFIRVVEGEFENFEGWIPNGAYRNQVIPETLGYNHYNEQDAMDHKAWQKHLPLKSEVV